MIFWNLISSIADKFQVDPCLAQAVMLQESGGKSYRTRYEPQFRYLKDTDSFARALGISELTEETHQKTSWGLMQVMGATARDLGFKGYFPQLCDPEIGAHYGCMYLAKKQALYATPWEVIAAYNAGSVKRIGQRFENQSYVDSVMKHYYAVQTALKKGDL